MGMVREEPGHPFDSAPYESSKGSTYPQPGTPRLRSSQELPSDLNFLGKVVEKVVSGLLSRHCEERGTLRLRRFGSEIEAVAALTGMVESAWAEKDITRAFCMGVAVASPSEGYPLMGMRSMDTGEDLVGWISSSLRGRRVRMIIDGQEKGIGFTTGLL